MGAKQSKRSVDISGKEAEGAGEVAAAGAGGEGRVEQLADADSLKPQINGDAHIHEQTEKEKELDSSTPENEKDATTEKEGKDQEKEEAPVTNGESEQKIENGESAPTPEDGKKPKKEKVKKKWSLRSISFSRKDKPKQEKKQKEEEPKTNGETEKVPEETAESPSEPPVNEVAEEVKPQTEDKEEKTPETPVTEPITNGSSTPESPKVEVALNEEPVAVNQESIDRPEPKADIEPEHLPVNGLSLEDPKTETPEEEQSEVRKLEASITETAEVVAAPEISVKKEVCVEQMPLIEPTPPPLPANPPPSSMASFAATTMAPESTDASLANTAENADLAQPTDPDTKDSVNAISPEPQITLTITETISTELPPPFKETCDENPVEISKAETTDKPTVIDLTQEIPNNEAVSNDVQVESEDIREEIIPESLNSEVEESSKQTINISEAIDDLPPPPVLESDTTRLDNVLKESNESQNDLHLTKEIINSNHIPDNSEINGFNNPIIDDNVATDQENIKNKTKDSLGNVIEDAECNGNIIEQTPITREEITIETVPSVIATEEVNEEGVKAVTTPEDSMPPSLSEAGASNDASESFPLPPSELCRSECEPSPPASPAAMPQDPVSVCDKMAEIVSEVVAIPELKTETLQETTSDVPVAN